MSTMQGLGYLLPAVEALRPPTRLTVSEWAERNIILTPETCPEPGPYRLDRTPYARGPMDAYGTPGVEHIVLKWASQTAKTTILYNCTGYDVDQDPGPALLVMPSDDLGRFVSKNRIQPMVEACEALSDKKDPDPDNFTTLEMKFRGMVLSIVGANSAGELASRPVRYLKRDEVNKFPALVGKEADPMSLSEERTKNFWNRKIMDVSTPSDENGNVTRQFDSCEAKFDYKVPCPHCAFDQVLTDKQIRYTEQLKAAGISEEDPNYPARARDVAYYECERCGGRIEDIHKPQMLRLGKWISREHGLELFEEIRRYRPRKIGFHLPSWYSPWVTFGQCAEKYERSRKYPEQMRNYENSWAAREYKDTIEEKSGSELMNNIIDLPPLVCPPGTLALTIGIDPGQGGYWFTVVAWKQDLTPHVVQYGFTVSRDELRRLVWENAYPVSGVSVNLSCWRGGMDTGGGKYQDKDTTMTEEAYAWIRDFGGGKVLGTKGSSHDMRGRKIKEIRIDKMPDGKAIPGGLVVWELDTDAFKDLIFYRIALQPNTPGRLTFHSDTKEEFIKHLLAEVKERDIKTGRTTWVRKSRSNHWFDCLSICFAMADPERGGVSICPPPVAAPREDSESSGERKTSWAMGGKKLPGGWLSGRNS